MNGLLHTCLLQFTCILNRVVHTHELGFNCVVNKTAFLAQPSLNGYVTTHIGTREGEVGASGLLLRAHSLAYYAASTTRLHSVRYRAPTPSPAPPNTATRSVYYPTSGQKSARVSSFAEVGVSAVWAAAYKLSQFE